MKLFTMLYLDERETSMHNAQTASFRAQIDLYVGCILNLQNSLRPEAIGLTVLTNNRALLQNANGANDLTIQEIPFTLTVPTGIRFYADHFKADVYAYFATLDEPYVGLIDNDVLAINPLPPVFREMIDAGIPAYYDITNAVHVAYGQARVLADKQRVEPDTKIGLWTGGEFMAGPPAFFGLLRTEIMRVIDAYFAVANELHHQSVEFLTSVAVENLLLGHRCTLVDAGSLGIVSRYWNSDTLHRQNALAAHTDSFLLHLPADKPLLAEAGRSGYPRDAFLQNYRTLVHRRRGLSATLRRRVRRLLGR